MNKRNTQSQDQKNKILALLKYFCMASLSQLTNITEQLLSKWKTKGTITKKRGGKKITYQILEDQLIQFFQQQRANQKKISIRIFQCEIVLRSEILKLNLKGSKGFIQKFCKRNHVTVRKINTKIIKQISEQEINEFVLKFQGKLNKKQYDLNHIINFDETCISKDEQEIILLRFKVTNMQKQKEQIHKKQLIILVWYQHKMARNYNNI
ncbi:hypothetical protein ABPG72_017196 [Tetrahymena utriculariae]